MPVTLEVAKLYAYERFHFTHIVPQVEKLREYNFKYSKITSIIIRDDFTCLKKRKRVGAATDIEKQKGIKKRPLKRPL